MACQVIIHSWTFPKLVGAFLDLFIAFCLLCCSAFAFFLSKFLAFFGFSLPCPCNGLFGHGPCLQRLLVDSPTDAISSVQLSVKTRFPFDSVLPRTRPGPCQLNLKLVRDRVSDDGVLELEGEAYITDRPSLQRSFSATDSFDKFSDVQRKRGSFRRRRRGSIDTKLIGSDQVGSEFHGVRRSPSDSNKIGDVESSALVNIHDSEPNDVIDERKLMYENAKSFQDLQNALGSGCLNDDVGGNAIKILQLALEEEQVARDALYSELEQERLAAATAADEAMAMIARLQEEKASVEIEARQFRRILEEKSAYDAEEMDILKEIIVRREREKHFLEKELEAYRKMFKASSESQSNDAQEHNDNSSLDLSADPMLILQQLSESIDKRKNVENSSSYHEFTSVDKRTCTVSENKELTIPPLDHKTQIINELESMCPSIVPDNLQSEDEVCQDFQEKGVLSCETTSSQGHSNISFQQNTIFDAVKSEFGEPHVHDVHIIDPSCSSCTNKDVTESDQMLIQDSAMVELEINRSSSDIVKQFPTASSSPSRSVLSQIRHNSLSAVDNEKLRIDCEIQWLRERLRSVQEEKERLKSSIENRERGKSELQFLKDIASQLQEIRHMAPEKAAHQTSLPPLSSKVMPKKRRSRNASTGVGQSDST